MPNLAVTPQPPPTTGGEIVLHQVIEDLNARAEQGYQKYGTYLTTHNGRLSLWDAYQEILDLIMYLRQHLMETKQDAI